MISITFEADALDDSMRDLSRLGNTPIHGGSFWSSRTSSSGSFICKA